MQSSLNDYGVIGVPFPLSIETNLCRLRRISGNSRSTVLITEAGRPSGPGTISVLMLFAVLCSSVIVKDVVSLFSKYCFFSRSGCLGNSSVAMLLIRAGDFGASGKALPICFVTI